MFYLKIEFIPCWYMAFNSIEYVISKKALMDLHEFFQLILLSSQI